MFISNDTWEGGYVFRGTNILYFCSGGTDLLLLTLGDMDFLHFNLGDGIRFFFYIFRRHMDFTSHFSLLVFGV